MTLSSLANILVEIILPIVLVALLGYILGRTFSLDARSLSKLTLYLFSPALTFTSAYRSKIDSEFVSIAVFAVLITALMGIVTIILIKVMNYDRLTASAFALSVLFVNAGNYGLPLILFAFGEEALARAVIFFTVSTILIQTLAVFIAARGTADARAATANIFKMPLVYAVIIGLALNLLRITVPDTLMKSADLMSDAAIPIMLVVLGLELAHASLDRDRLHIGLAAFAKLGITPVIAFALGRLMGLSGVTLAVCVIESSMPTAVMASVLAVEFRSRPEFVTGAVLVSTLGSVLSLTILLGILRG